MAEYLSAEDLENAKQDAATLGEVVNADNQSTVESRLGEVYPSLANALYTVIQAGGFEPFQTQTALLASVPTVPKKAAYALDTGKVWFWNGSSWADTGLSALDQAKADATAKANAAQNAAITAAASDASTKATTAETNAKNYADANPLFKPAQPSSSDNLDNITVAGIYQIYHDTRAKELGLPTGLAGQVYVGGVTVGTPFVYQTYINTNGEVYQRVNAAGVWSAWNGLARKSLTTTDNLNTITREGFYQAAKSVATQANNYPFVSSDAIVLVTSTTTTVRQQVLSAAGSAHRTATISSGVVTWGVWRGIQYPAASIGNLDGFISLGTPNYVSLTDIATIGGHLDNATVSGAYHSILRATATTENGFPITGQTGFLTIRAAATKGLTSQMWQTYDGWAMRWGSYASDNIVWQPWKGFKNTGTGVVDIATGSSGATIKPNLVLYGSSTLWYLSSAMANLATRKNMALKNHALSGDTLAAAGLSQGSNIVTVAFATSPIMQGVAMPVTITNEFEGNIRGVRNFELSNGVKGDLDYDNATFKATNAPVDGVAVTVGEPYRVTEPAWLRVRDGVYVINIGKNNMSSSVDNSDEIFADTVKMINYLPAGTQFIVGGHYSNQIGTTNAQHHSNVFAVNAKLKAKYGLLYFDINELLFDDATWIKLGLTKTSDDIAAIAAQRLPPSLAIDLAHLSTAMSAELALHIENKLTALGYI